MKRILFSTCLALMVALCAFSLSGCFLFGGGSSEETTQEESSQTGEEPSDVDDETQAEEQASDGAFTDEQQAFSTFISNGYIYGTVDVVESLPAGTNLSLGVAPGSLDRPYVISLYIEIKVNDGEYLQGMLSLARQSGQPETYTVVMGQAEGLPGIQVVSEESEELRGSIIYDEDQDGLVLQLPVSFVMGDIASDSRAVLPAEENLGIPIAFSAADADATALIVNIRNGRTGYVQPALSDTDLGSASKVKDYSLVYDSETEQWSWKYDGPAGSGSEDGGSDG